MDNTFLIFENQNISDCRYKIYQLNVPFDQELKYTLADQTKVIITDAEGHCAFLTPLWLYGRKNNIEAQGEHVTIENPTQSEKILSNLKALIETGKIELPNAIRNLLHFNSNINSLDFPVDHTFN